MKKRDLRDLFLMLIMIAPIPILGCSPATAPTTQSVEANLEIEQLALSTWESIYNGEKSKLSAQQQSLINALDSTAQTALSTDAADLAAGGSINTSADNAYWAAIANLALAIPSL